MPTTSLALDATYAADPARTGTGVYSYHLISALAALPQVREVVDFRLVLCFRPGPYLRHARRQSWPKGSEIAMLWEPWLRPRRVRLFHGLNQRLPDAAFPARVVTIHDLFPLTSKDYSTPEFQQHFSSILRKAVRSADRIIAVSDATRLQLLQHTDARDERIRVIHHGVQLASQPSPQEVEALKTKTLGLAQGEGFFLSVGTIQTRKNIANIVLAAKGVSGFRLVIVGGDGYGADQVHSLIEREGVAGRIILLGHTPPETLRLLYAAATALVFPSLEEGFGIPILEAMGAGLPVITSNCSAMPEVAGDAAVYVDPRDVSQIRDAMLRIAEDEPFTSELRRRGMERARQFTWERCASQTWSVYEELMAK